MGAVVGEDSLKLDSFIWEGWINGHTRSVHDGHGPCHDSMRPCMHVIWWWWTARFEKGEEEEKDRHAHSQRSGRSVLIGSRILMHNK